MNNHFMKNPITRSLALFLSFVALANAETSNPLYPRPSGGAGAEGLKKQILISPPPGRGRGKTSMKLP